MNKAFNYYRWLSIFAVVIILILVVLQGIWFQKAIEVETSRMELSLKQILPDLALETSQITRGYFKKDSLRFDAIPLVEVEKKVRAFLIKKGIQTPTYFAYYEKEDLANFKSNAAQYKSEFLATEVRSCVSCIISFSIGKPLSKFEDETEEAHARRMMENSTFEYFAPVQNLKNKEENVVWLALYQPHTFTAIMKSLLWLIIVNLILLIFLFALFFYLLKLLANYNKIGQLKDDFFNNMTHEFKTPLSSIRLASKVLMNNKKPEKTSTYLGIIEKESKSLEAQIDKLLTLSLIENKQIDLEKKSINLEEIIKEVSQRMFPLLEAQNSTMTIDFQLPDPYLNGDHDHWLSSLCNLVENSIKYADESVNVRISTYLENHVKVISIQDNGPGIKPEFRNQIFDRFYRGKKKNEYKNKGFGIGLSYVKSIVEAHNGSIYLNPKYENGCEFIIKLKA